MAKLEDSMYVITGASGHTGNLIAKRLLSEGKRVRVVARSAERLASLVSLGAEASIADVTDKQALINAFSGAQAAYVMIPPDVTNKDLRTFQDQVTDALATAVEKNRVAHVVALSSIGADKADKTGPILGLHYLEERFKNIPGLNLLFLRAGYFMENTLAQSAIVQQMGATAGPLLPELAIPMIATRDIGNFVADALLRPDFKGHQTRELLGRRDINMREVTAIIGKAIGKPDLVYRQITEEQFGGALTQMGVSENVAGLFTEMSQSLNSGHVRALESRSEQNTTPTSYEEFVQQEFLPIYRSSSTAA
jgi:uncharacterized protein YbjT (DUF2867 family)